MRFFIKKIITLLLSVLIFNGIFAQQMPNFAHYMHNQQKVNPAFAGFDGILTITNIHRTQWTGFDGAPKTQSINLSTLLNNNYTGIGLSLLNDRIGPVNSTSAFVNYSYNINLSSESSISLGISAGADILQKNLGTIAVADDNDPDFINNMKNQMDINFGIGMLYRKNDFYAGVSVPELIETAKFSDLYSDSFSFERYRQRHYYFTTGTKIELNHNISIIPTLTTKVLRSAPIQCDISALLEIMEVFTVGPLYRTGDAIGFLIGFHINDSFLLGYSYDHSYGLGISSYNQGSHEVMIKFQRKKKVESANFF